MKKKLLITLFIALFTVMAAVTASAADIWDGTVAKGFESGSGTESDPYIVKTPEQLAFLAKSVNSGTSYYKKYISLANDIKLNDTTNWKNWATAAPKNSWTPIGNRSNPFSGIFDGRGHEISGIYINTELSDQGLFGYIDDSDSYECEVKNVGVVDSYIHGLRYVGGVVGASGHGTVTNCYNTGNISGDYLIGGVVGFNRGTVSGSYNSGTVSGTSPVGGVVGDNDYYGTIYNCYNSGTVSGTNSVGGVAGDNSGTVSNCYNIGKVSGTINVGDTSNCVGGIVGCNTGEGAIIANCYNLGNVSGTEVIGGIAGENGDYGIITSCYNLGNVSGAGEHIGGVLGNDWTALAISNCYYLSGCAKDGNNVTQYGIGNGIQGSTTSDISGKTLGLSKEQMKLKDSFVGFDFKNVWTIEPLTGYEYPQFMKYLDKSYGEASAIWDGSVAESFNSGSGTKVDPYIIKTAEQLAYFAASVNSGTTYSGEFIQLANDIKLNDNTKKYWILNAAHWIPIGAGYPANKPFSGTFDGQGHEISGIYIDTALSYQGLFGYVSGGTVKNIGVVDSYIHGNSEVGGVVGDNIKGIVENCYNSGIISGNFQVGGVVGINNDTVENCYNSGIVSGTGDCVGGVVGYNYSNNTVENSYNIGTVSGNSTVGGVVGFNDKGTAEKCYNTGTVSGNFYVGGIVGGNENHYISYNKSIVQTCYNTGTVSGDYCVGGVVGSGSATNCYNTGKVSGADSHVGGVVGSGSATNCYNTGKVSGDYLIGGVVGYNGDTIQNCYYLTGCAKDGNSVVQYGIGNSTKGCTTADVSGKTAELSDNQMKDKASFAGFDFATVWAIDKTINNGYPYLQSCKAANKDMENSISLTIGSKAANAFGIWVMNDVAPIVYNDRTMIPARFIAESLGATVGWNAAEHKVTITGKHLKTGEAVEINMFIEMKTAYINGEAVRMDTVPFIRDNRTYTPVRFIVEALGATVAWDGATSTATITR